MLLCLCVAMLVSGALHALVSSKQPLYLIATSTSSTPTTYFGAAPSLNDTRSTVFAFRDRAAAVDVARGLEQHKRVTGTYPAPDDVDGQLDVTAPTDWTGLTDVTGLTDLVITRSSVAEALRLVKGSGLAVSIMLRSNDTHGTYKYKSVDVRSSRCVDRAWLERMLYDTKPAMPALLPKPVQRFARDATTAPVMYDGVAWNIFEFMFMFMLWC